VPGLFMLPDSIPTELLTSYTLKRVCVCLFTSRSPPGELHGQQWLTQWQDQVRLFLPSRAAGQVPGTL